MNKSKSKTKIKSQTTRGDREPGDAEMKIVVSHMIRRTFRIKVGGKEIMVTVSAYFYPEAQ